MRIAAHIAATFSFARPCNRPCGRWAVGVIYLGTLSHKSGMPVARHGTRPE